MIIDPARLCLKSVRLEPVKRRMGFDKFSPNGLKTLPCRINSCLVRATFALCLFLPPLAHAHVGAGVVTGWISGLAHPLGGLDHCLAMLAVGIWAAQMGQRSIWAVPPRFCERNGAGWRSTSVRLNWVPTA